MCASVTKSATENMLPHILRLPFGAVYPPLLRVLGPLGDTWKEEDVENKLLENFFSGKKKTSPVMESTVCLLTVYSPQRKAHSNADLSHHGSINPSICVHITYPLM